MLVAVIFFRAFDAVVWAGARQETNVVSQAHQVTNVSEAVLLAGAQRVEAQECGVNHQYAHGRGFPANLGSARRVEVMLT
jgi:hypothetical protein